MAYLSQVGAPVFQSGFEESVNANRQTLTACDDYTAVKRRPNNEWTVMQTVIVGWLFTDYSISWSDITKIFNACFKDELPTAHGLSTGAVTSRWYATVLSEYEAAAIAALQASSCSKEKAKGFESMAQALVKRTAAELDIHLIARENTSTSTASKIIASQNVLKKRKLPAHSQSSTHKSCNLPISGTGSRYSLQTPKRARLSPLPSTPRRSSSVHDPIIYPTPTSQGVHIYHTPPITSKPIHEDKMILSGGKSLAILAFRAFSRLSQGSFSTEKGFRAQPFIDDPPSCRAPDPTSSWFVESATLHVEMDKTEPSPFMSVTKNPIRALHRAYQDQSSEMDAFIAVIDLVEADRKGFVFKATTLGLKPRCRWNSGGEYLIYGEILPSAIISVHPVTKLTFELQTLTMPDDESPLFQIDMLQEKAKLSKARPKIAKESKNVEISYGLGLAVGRFVHAFAIPPSFFSDGIWACMQDYKFGGDGNKGWRNWKKNAAFNAGAEAGYHRRRPDRSTYLKSGDDFEVIEAAEAIPMNQASPMTDSDADYDFLAELREAAETESGNVGMENVPFRYRSAQEVRLIDWEQVTMAQDVLDDNGKREDEDHANAVDTPIHKREDVYTCSWTGM